MLSSTAQVKKHHSIWVAFISSALTKANRSPRRSLKHPHYFEQGRNKCSNLEPQKLLALAPRWKREAEGLQLTGKWCAASLRAQQASQTSTLLRVSVHTHTVTLHPAWQQSCTGSCQRVTDCGMQPGAARPPTDPTANTLYKQLKSMPTLSNTAGSVILFQSKPETVLPGAALKTSSNLKLTKH